MEWEPLDAGARTYQMTVKAIHFSKSSLDGVKSQMALIHRRECNNIIYQQSLTRLKGYTMWMIAKTNTRDYHRLPSIHRQQTNKKLNLNNNTNCAYHACKSMRPQHDLHWSFELYRKISPHLNTNNFHSLLQKHDKKTQKFKNFSSLQGSIRSFVIKINRINRCYFTSLHPTTVLNNEFFFRNFSLFSLEKEQQEKCKRIDCKIKDSWWCSKRTAGRSTFESEELFTIQPLLSNWQ